jgi:NADPH:quinone reductase-like Zn-dependent oxidoreductase
MKAIVQDRYGSPDVLELRDIAAPVAGDNDVLIRVHAAGCGPNVWHLMTGLPYFAGSDAHLVIEIDPGAVAGLMPGGPVFGAGGSLHGHTSAA